jgi:hypothetical protein
MLSKKKFKRAIKILKVSDGINKFDSLVMFGVFFFIESERFDITRFVDYAVKEKVIKEVERDKAILEIMGKASDILIDEMKYNEVD